MDAALATFAHFTISERTSAANCPGVLVTGSTPRSSRRLLVAGFLTIVTSASLSFATISFGVAAGARMPYQVLMSKPGRPDSLGGGNLGNSGWGSGGHTARGLSRRASTNGIAA